MIAKILACATVVTWLAHYSTADAQTFDGITIIEVSDEVAEVIRGQPAGVADPYLVTFVTGNGTYAALEDGEKRACVAWAQDGSYSGGSIAFGLPPSEQSLKLVDPSVCQPFTLSFSGVDRVRVEATNKHGRSGPLDPNAKELRYSAKHPLVASVPLIAFDWGMPVFASHDIKGVPLGPLPVLMERLGKTADLKLSPLENLSAGPRKVLSLTIYGADRTNATTIEGNVAAAEVLGWPWDVLHVASYRERLTTEATTGDFEQAAIERYGAPSRIETRGTGAATRRLQWFFDLQGQQLVMSSATPGNCLSTREHWIDHIDYRRFTRDIGPWGCSLILLLIDDGWDGSVKAYSIQAASGYAMALNHFMTRLEEVRAMRQEIEAVQAYKPKL
jgi:hypothetical protein